MELCEYISKHVTLPPTKNTNGMISRVTPIYNNIAKAFKTPINELRTASSIPVPFTSQSASKDFLYIPYEMRIYMMRCKTAKQIHKTFLYDKGHIVNVNLWFPSSRTTSKDSNLVFEKIWKWFLFCFNTKLLDIKPCSNTLTIFLYMIPMLKKLPKKNVQIDRQHVNGGFSYPCKDNSNVIYIFRREEWFKVLIHETLHTSKMDFSTVNYKTISTSIREKVFPGVPENKFILSETYVEIWATILVLLVNLWENNNSLQLTRDMAKQFITRFQYEKIWSIIQTIKVLQHKDITYDALLRGTKYREGESNIFSYYVLKSIVCVFLEDYLSSPLKINTIHSFGKFILDYAKSVEFISIIHNVEPFRKHFNDSLRMTLE
jgi:hypothetical protein